jgi:type I restriction enzyme S subunit
MEQQKIASILSTADEKLENLQSKKSQYEQLKKGLMQKLLTGKIRVKVN